MCEQFGYDRFGVCEDTVKLLSILLVAFVLLATPQTGIPKPPFSIAVVPTDSQDGGGGIEMAHKMPREFYVVLTNISQENQRAWVSWYSWGYQAISFELTTIEGKKFIARVKTKFSQGTPPRHFLYSQASIKYLPFGLMNSGKSVLLYPRGMKCL
jgi:hypothetical protein